MELAVAVTTTPDAVTVTWSATPRRSSVPVEASKSTVAAGYKAATAGASWNVVLEVLTSTSLVAQVLVEEINRA